MIAGITEMRNHPSISDAHKRRRTETENALSGQKGCSSIRETQQFPFISNNFVIRTYLAKKLIKLKIS
jgi:hypothetical protein